MLNHKVLGCACLLLLVAAFSTADVEPEPVLIKHINQQNLNGAGQYNHEIEVSNGIRNSAHGDVNAAYGEYFLPGNDAEQPVHVTYTADANGFHAQIN